MSIYALDEQFVPSLTDAVVMHDADAPVDPELRRRGTPHLDEVLARSSGTFDGPILALDRVDRGQIHAVRAGYFDMIATCDSLAADPELHAYASELAAPDPLRIGTGRAAAIGLSAIVVRGGVFTLGRRSDALPLDPAAGTSSCPGRWIRAVPSERWQMSWPASTGSAATSVRASSGSASTSPGSVLSWPS